MAYTTTFWARPQHDLYAPNSRPGSANARKRVGFVRSTPRSGSAWPIASVGGEIASRVGWLLSVHQCGEQNECRIAS